MSETILCGRCDKRMAMEDAEIMLLSPGTAAPWEAIDETNAPAYELVCADCRQAPGEAA